MKQKEKDLVKEKMFSPNEFAEYGEIRYKEGCSEERKLGRIEGFKTGWTKGREGVIRDKDNFWVDANGELCYRQQTIGKLKGVEDIKKGVIKEIENFQNPYPKDVFRWNNLEMLNFNRGRFNQFCFEIVENMRRDLLMKVQEQKEWESFKRKNGKISL